MILLMNYEQQKTCSVDECHFCIFVFNFVRHILHSTSTCTANMQIFSFLQHRVFFLSFFLSCISSETYYLHKFAVDKEKYKKLQVEKMRKNHVGRARYSADSLHPHLVFYIFLCEKQFADFLMS